MFVVCVGALIHLQKIRASHSEGFGLLTCTWFWCAWRVVGFACFVTTRLILGAPGVQEGRVVRPVSAMSACTQFKQREDPCGRSYSHTDVTQLGVPILLLYLISPACIVVSETPGADIVGIGKLFNTVVANAMTVPHMRVSHSHPGSWRLP